MIDSSPQEDLTERLADERGEWLGKRIGRYRLLKRIGEGGCGVVFLAEQLDPVKRQVALKVIRRGMDTERVIIRFEMERQSLAKMDHPNIARVLDAGSTESGLPFFVMEWVRGLRITEYCDENHLDIHQRIELFIEVCQAIHHAHQKGVVHRDVKPSNILISQENSKPIPKVIDFGVAKAIERNLGDSTALTFNDQFVGTPAYMSPEQADQRHQDIDTRSDVYGLGMLLYELLTGRTPFDSLELAAAGLTEMRKILNEREPATPSASLTALPPNEAARAASSRGTGTGKLISAMKGDLDSVVMKAIEKDRCRRYETVNGLIMDLQRYNAHLPVLARPQGRVYLFSKFVRRNRLAVLAAAATVLSLVVGLGAASTYYLREKKAREEQFRLRQRAETAHRNELRRLNEAQQWESFAHVSVLLSEGKTGEADEQLRQTPLTVIKLTPQSAAVLRSLGNWNALRGRWDQAAECFQALQKADEMNRSERLIDSLDLVAIGCVLLEIGRSQDYRTFCNWALDRFGDSSSPLEISRLFHAVLLLPPDKQMLAKLDKLRPLLEIGPIKSERSQEAVWRAFGLALLEYRQGNFERSLYWSDRGMPMHKLGHIIGSFEPVRAMANHRLGNAEAAGADLASCRIRIERAFSPELPAAYEPFGRHQGFWWDWIIVRIMFRESESLLGRE